MRSSARLRRTVTTLLCATALQGCGSDQTQIVGIAGGTPARVTIAPQSATLGFIGATTRFTATVRDAQGAPVQGLDVRWSSSAPSIVSISSSGEATAIAEGEATIIARVVNLADSATATVVRLPATVQLNADSILLTTLGETFQLSGSVADGGGQTLASSVVTWSSDDPQVATVDANGVVTAVGQGTTLIRAQAGAIIRTVPVRVAVGPATMQVDPAVITFDAVGEQDTVVATVFDAAGKVLETPVVWASADTAVAKVDATGVVTASGPGSTVVTASADSVSREIAVSVNQEPARLTVLPDTARTSVGSSAQFAVLIEDPNGFVITGLSSSVTWASLNDSVATVDANGLATGLVEGEATIVASLGTLSDSAVVLVGSVRVASADVTPPSLLLGVGKTAQLSAVPFDSTGAPVSATPASWTTSDAAVATVDSLGVVTGVGQGTAWIIADFETARDSSFVTVTSTVVPPPAGEFDIELRFVGTPPSPEQINAFRAAEARWERVLVGDQEEGTVSLDAGSCGIGHPALGETIDDMLLLVEVGSVDGPGRAIADVGLCVVRTSNGLPILSVMRVDVSDLNLLEGTTDLDNLMIREMGHALGFGTSAPWDLILLGDGGSDPYFPGVKAVAEFTAAGFAATRAVPVEATGGFGVRDRRWRENVLGREVMTGFLDSGVSNPLSRITVGAMEDLGYVVSLDGADAFPPSSLAAGPAAPKLDFRTRLLPTRFGVEPGGRMVRLRAR